jgi:hypothetical protein
MPTSITLVGMVRGSKRYIRPLQLVRNTMKSGSIRIRVLFLAGVLLFALAPTTARAAPTPAASSPALLASGGGWRMYWAKFEDFVHNSFRSRERLIQISALAVALGLFIMYRARRT